MDVDRAFGQGLLLGQIVIHCEHIRAGGKLAAQIGCDRENLELACDAIRREGCQFIVEDNVSPERVAVWIYQKWIAETLIRSLDREAAPSPSSAVIAGKLFGYSDHEIEQYVTGQFPSEHLKATSESKSSQRRDSGIAGWRKVQVC
jgi:hypothetical protein